MSKGCRGAKTDAFGDAVYRIARRFEPPLRGDEALMNQPAMRR